MAKEARYIAIDLKSFYASVACRDRGLDPLAVNLVVADAARTEKTICLAVSPALKAYGLPGRPRLFEVVEKIREVNARRARMAPGKRLTGASWDDRELRRHPAMAVDYLVAPPQMARYMAVSTQIYGIYLKYVAPEDIHVYSIDEVFIDATPYLATYGVTARELAMRMILDVLKATGITATAGIGTNLYLCKVAMDIQAKSLPPDANGVRIAELDEASYRQALWAHRPLTDFWRVGPGYARKLEAHGMYTMGDVARCSLGQPGAYHNEALLYQLFGVNAELLIDHAWGWESCTMADIKAYRPEASSLCSGQVLPTPYTFAKARLIVREMADALALSLVDRGWTTAQLALDVGYDAENLAFAADRAGYKGQVATDRYGRSIPRHAHGVTRLERPTASSRQIIAAATALFERIASEKLLVRRLNLAACQTRPAEAEKRAPVAEQLDLFTDYAARQARRQAEEAELARERRMQETLLFIKKKYGNNAVLRAMSLEEGATARERNNQIGGHKA